MITVVPGVRRRSLAPSGRLPIKLILSMYVWRIAIVSSKEPADADRRKPIAPPAKPVDDVAGADERKSGPSSLASARSAVGKAAGMAKRLGRATADKVQGTARSAAGVVSPLLETAQHSSGVILAKAGEAAHSVGKAGQSVLHTASAAVQPMIHTTKQAAASISETVDPIAVGGAVAGMSTGELIGGAIGGVIGAVAGPGGALIGAELGAFAGMSVGVKLGYDVTHEVVHPEAALPNATLKDRVNAVARTVTSRAGDAVGGGVGAAGGAMVGSLLAGPAGGAVGSFVGEAIAGRVGEERAEDLYAKADLLAADVQQADTAAQTGTESDRRNTRKWLEEVACDTAKETGAAATLGIVGDLVGGALGKKIGQRAGAVAAKHVGRSSTPKGKPNEPTVDKPTGDENESTPIS